jgi:hypothetical protein
LSRTNAATGATGTQMVKVFNGPVSAFQIYNQDRLDATAALLTESQVDDNFLLLEMCKNVTPTIHKTNIWSSPLVRVNLKGVGVMMIFR